MEWISPLRFIDDDMTEGRKSNAGKGCVDHIRFDALSHVKIGLDVDVLLLARNNGNALLLHREGNVAVHFPFSPSCIGT